MLVQGTKDKEPAMADARVVPTVHRSRLVYPDKQTISGPAGTSHLCQVRSSTGRLISDIHRSADQMPPRSMERYKATCWISPRVMPKFDVGEEHALGSVVFETEWRSFHIDAGVPRPALQFWTG